MGGRMSKQKTLDDWLSEIMQGETPKSGSTSPQAPREIDFESLSDAIKELEKALQSRVDLPTSIAAVVITSYIMPGSYFGRYQGMRYLLVNRDTWESWLPQFEKSEASLLAQLSGIPVFDDEDLARRIIISSISTPRSIIDPGDLGSMASS
jgi:hypothetical protein